MSDQQAGEGRTESRIPEPMIESASGPTVLWGYLLQSGGARPTAVILLDDNRRMRIKVSKRLAKELGTRLYENVGIKGIATWRTSDWQIESFQGRELTEYRPHKFGLKEGFKGLSDASEGRWESIDVSEYVKKLREEE